MPPQDQSEDQLLPESYQSVGSDGVAGLRGKLLASLDPVDEPVFDLSPSPEVWHDPEISAGQKQGIADDLFLKQLLIQAKMDAVPAMRSRAGRDLGRRGHLSRTLDQIIVTGDSLEEMTDEYRSKLFRRDQYITLRDSSGLVLYHVVRERIDLLALPEDVLARAELDSDQRNHTDPEKRMVEHYTLVEYQPRSNNWVIRQEINDRTVLESQDKVSPYFSTATNLAPGENYGRGLVEQNLAGLRSLNALYRARHNLLALAANAKPVIDEDSNVTPEDLAKPAGTPIRARVRDGRVVDLAFLGYEKSQDFNMIDRGIADLTDRMNRAFLVESEAGNPGGRDRVTRFERSRVALELDSTMGGTYVVLAESMTYPRISRMIWQMERDKLITPTDDDLYEIHIRAGFAQVVRSTRSEKLLTLSQVMAGLQAFDWLNPDQIARAYSRYESIYEPGIIKSPQERAAEQQAQLQAQAQQVQSEQGAIAGREAATQLASAAIQERQ